jgi:acylpyruvate hydrolase
LATFEYDGQVFNGVLLDDDFMICLNHAERVLPDSLLPDWIKKQADGMISLITNTPDSFQAIENLRERVKEKIAFEQKELISRQILFEKKDIRLKAPILKPSKIICIGLNYMDHCREQNVEPPESPVIFCKFPTSIIGHGDKIRWNPELTAKVDYEAELAVVIGKQAWQVRREKAYDYIVGYTALNDTSARDLQFSDGQWVRGKSLDTFCPMGPVLVTKDEIPDPHSLKIRCKINDLTLQDSSTAEMIFKIPYLIEFITRGITLETGDIITTGTPHGVGVFRKPEIYLKSGDRIRVEIEKIGTLENWAEETT